MPFPFYGVMNPPFRGPNSREEAIATKLAMKEAALRTQKGKCVCAFCQAYASGVEYTAKSGAKCSH